MILKSRWSSALDTRSPTFEPDQQFFFCVSAGDVQFMTTDGAWAAERSTILNQL